MENVKLFGEDANKLAAFVFFALLIALIPDYSWATTTTTPGFVDACKNVTGFFKNFETILKVASVSIVTIAVVFAGYQIAFAHKRLSDVAPILIGGLLIGGAATIAGWFVADWKADTNALGANGECAKNT